MKKVLLTGIGGFIGSHTMEHILENTDWEIVGIASWKHKGTPERIFDSELYQKNKHRVNIITHDLVSPFTDMTKKQIGKINYIFNVASESHVERSITDPVPFVKNNVDLVLNMLEFAREIKPEIFIQCSTDEVYGAAPVGTNHKEWSPILPSNPYSASKAAQEAIAISYWRTYGVPVVITNTMNNMGQRQDPEKFVALCIRKIISGETIQIHGTEENIGSRFYLHARNHADAFLYITKNLKPKMFPSTLFPDRYNIVGEIELNNLEVAKKIATIIGKELKYELIDFHSARSGHDPRYALDGSKLESLGWKAPVSFDESLKDYIEWTLLPKNSKWL